jgi:catechol 2,3-dioxygenase-like lactoylglutathione lyase family enzyme
MNPMQFYMVELPVRDLGESVAWYRDRLGMHLTHLDEVHGFALLEATSRLALKRASIITMNVTLHFHVDSLDELLAHLARHAIALDAPPKQSDEGYRRIFVRDPDGHRVGFFEWHANTTH